MRIINLALVVAAAVVTILIIVATATPVATFGSDGGVKTTLTLWQSKSSYAGQESTVKVVDMGCKAARTRLQAAEAFAILSIFAGVASTAMLALFLLGKKVVSLMIGAIVPAAVTGFCCFLVWILEANVYSTSFDGCGSALSKVDGAALSASFALFLISSVAFPAIGVAFWFLNKNADFTSDKSLLS